MQNMVTKEMGEGDKNDNESYKCGDGNTQKHRASLMSSIKNKRSIVKLFNLTLFVSPTPDNTTEETSAWAQKGFLSCTKLYFERKQKRYQLAHVTVHKTILKFQTSRNKSNCRKQMPLSLVLIGT